MILFFIVVAAVNGTTVSASGTEEVVLDTGKIDEFVRSEMKAGDIPGLAISIVLGDKVLYLKGYGRARAEGTPVTPQTPFILGSISKGLTGLAVMRLVDRGEIDLDVPIKNYLPYFKPEDTTIFETVTVRQLLSHTSGISNYSGSKLRKPEEPLEEFLKEQVNLKLQHPAGENFEYSSLNYDILGAVIETVSGKSYKDFIKEEVFIPLEMDQSYANIKEGVEGGLADGYRNLFGLEFPGKT
ncbi:MAG: serine hydrolase domain-containing protein, partial [Bacteroidota bacterium]|nr:serine hydrolase domain-containing protein [Bacteroidota bacterium]